jgi:hypothetical protein
MVSSAKTSARSTLTLAAESGFDVARLGRAMVALDP